MVPAPQFYQEKNASAEALLFFGTSRYAAEEAMELFTEQGKTMDAIRLLSFPFSKAVKSFIDSHEKVYVIEQNRDAQMRSLLMIELGINPDKLVPVLNYNGMPITADNILKQVGGTVNKAILA